ncbi:hypothetical protein C8J56DRAFT_1169661 [Mycena floridula]|nr:hypothetical protein C8J56DRAFT_1169661 [Mycena floridula]
MSVMVDSEAQGEPISNKVPLELVEEIVAHNADDFKTIIATSLVSRQMRQASFKLLFHTIDLSSQRNLMHWQEMIDRIPALAGHIRTVIYAPKVTFEAGYSPLPVYPVSLDILPAVAMLQCVSMSPPRAEFFRFFPSVTELELSQLQFQDSYELGKVLGNFPQLRALSLNHAWFKGETSSKWESGSPCDLSQINTLSLEGMSKQASKWSFCSLLVHCPLVGLRTLTLVGDSAFSLSNRDLLLKQPVESLVLVGTSFGKASIMTLKSLTLSMKPDHWVQLSGLPSGRELDDCPAAPALTTFILVFNVEHLGRFSTTRWAEDCTRSLETLLEKYPTFEELVIRVSTKQRPNWGVQGATTKRLHSLMPEIGHGVRILLQWSGKDGVLYPGIEAIRLDSGVA